MTQPSNKLSNFWQELKRRNVVRVITVYIAVSLAILELVSNISEPFGLPDWTLKLVFVILIIGLILAVILSWIYDIHPERGMVKTEPTDNVEVEDIPKSSNSWKIASYISFVVIVGLIVLNIFPYTGKKEILDKSIAVLPFRNDSPDEEKMYFINGTMDAILDNLCKIADLRVVSRNSVEQYRDNPKPTPVVAEEMKVSYVLEGSGQKIGNRILLIVQLIDGRTDQHLWSKQYDREIEKVEDLIDIQKEISELVAGEIEAIITPEEQELIEKIPTTSLTAYDFYQKGREEHYDYWFKGNLDALERAEALYNEALANDSTYAQAYVGLAQVYWNKYQVDTYFAEDFMDSVIVLTDMALSYDNQLAEAYSIRGEYYFETGQPDRAIREINRSIEINPNDWYSYRTIGYFNFYTDKLMTLEALHKALSLNRGPERLDLLMFLGNTYRDIGFMEQATQYWLEAFKLNRDSLTYYFHSYLSGQMDLLEYRKIAYALDSSNNDRLWWLGSSYYDLDRYEESFTYISKWMEEGKIQNVGILASSSHRIGHIYWLNGHKEEAEKFFNQQIEYCKRAIELGRTYATVTRYAYYDLAAVYAFRGEKEKAYENLSIFNQRKIFGFWLTKYIDWDPLFESIRDEPEFQQIVSNIKTKYQAEHERVRQWLEDNDML